MTKIEQWSDIQGDFHTGTLLLGNGSSIAVSTCFSYSSLYERAAELNFLTPEVKAVFEKFDVHDFELVLRRLWQAKLVNEALEIPRGEVELAYENVRHALIETIREIHVSYEDAHGHLETIFQFMKQYQIVISLNYDLIVYWAAQLGNRSLGSWFKDCFRSGKFRSDWEVVSAPYGAAEGATLYFYPHGNLVLVRDKFTGERKIKAGTNAVLLDAIFEKWKTDNLAPAFICEGTKENKLRAIASCNYFERVFFEVLPSPQKTLTIFGWGFGVQDGHILQQIRKSGVRRIAVSVFPNNDVQRFVGHVEQVLQSFNLEKLVFFDSTSAGCWNNSSCD
jgi:hypothetical protein